MFQTRQIVACNSTLSVHCIIPKIDYELFAVKWQHDFFLLVAVFWALLLFSILHVLAINFHFQAWQDEWGTLARGLWVSARLQGSTTNSFWCFRQCTLCAKARYQRLKNSSSPDFLSPIFLNPKYESHSNYPEFMTLVVPRFAMSNGSTTLKIFSCFIRESSKEERWTYND